MNTQTIAVWVNHLFSYKKCPLINDCILLYIYNEDLKCHNIVSTYSTMMMITTTELSLALHGEHLTCHAYREHAFVTMGDASRERLHCIVLQVAIGL